MIKYSWRKENWLGQVCFCVLPKILGMVEIFDQ